MANSKNDDVMKTPYEYHKLLTGHKMTTFSPDGINIIEECECCGNRWMLPNKINRYTYPVHLGIERES